MIHAKDLTGYGGGKEAEAKIEVNDDAPISSGGTKPNAFTKWGDPLSERGGKVKRPVDFALSGMERKSCAKCNWTTMSEDGWKSHNRKDSMGRILCEREKADFKEMRRCSACNGEAAVKGVPCQGCSGLGFVKDSRVTAAGADADEIAEKVGARIDRTMREGFGMIAAVLEKALSGRAKETEKEDHAGAGALLGGALADGQAPGPDLGSDERPVEDPSEESA